MVSWDQTKKYRLEQEEINLLAAMIDSKSPIVGIDFEAGRKAERKSNAGKAFQTEANNPSEFSKRDEVCLKFYMPILFSHRITPIFL